MSLIDFEFLFRPVEELDAWLTGLFAGAPLLVALGIAFVLGMQARLGPRSPGRGHLAGGRRRRRHPQRHATRRLVGPGPRCDSGPARGAR